MAMRGMCMAMLALYRDNAPAALHYLQVGEILAYLGQGGQLEIKLTHSEIRPAAFQSRELPHGRLEGLGVGACAKHGDHGETVAHNAVEQPLLGRQAHGERPFRSPGTATAPRQRQQGAERGKPRRPAKTQTPHHTPQTPHHLRICGYPLSHAHRAGYRRLCRVPARRHGAPRG